MQSEDIVSEVFSTLRLKAHLYFEAKLATDFSIEIPKERRLIRFHMVLEGACWVVVPDFDPVCLTAGDVVLIPDGSAQILASDPTLKPSPLPKLLTPRNLEKGVFRYDVEDEAPANRLLCGYCQFDEALDHPVLKTLPPLVLLKLSQTEQDPVLDAFLKPIRKLADQPVQGRDALLTRLIEGLFIQTVMGQYDNTGSGSFVASLQDWRIAKALTCIHQNPETAWTIDSLAKEAGMSRARFADLFNRLVGIPPIQYLSLHRLSQGRVLLKDTNLGLDEIASRCGYASASSFSRRFKEEFGLGPGAYRRAG
ncbi:AraC family transcriptional regulator [Sneathiella limimaris]|uniref:AraC family transcriptional regulator n=1 Tax=Sneathiella limimaris TaxID=1964213 RepID=UPI00146C79DD|nr:AraC family transcriptional regulator [Sneathiella limimaris]